MLDKVKYWLDLCCDDLATAKVLFEKERLLHMGFFCHLIAEKALKAVISNKTNAIPPKIHDLQRLARLGGIFEKLSIKQFNLIDRLTPLQIEARYPEHKEKIAKFLTKEYCQKLLIDTEEFLCWIKKLLES